MSLSKLIKSKKTVFKLDEISSILDIENKNYLRVYVNRMKKRGELKMISKGLYAISNDYNPF